jgi:hypothetical protein
VVDGLDARFFGMKSGDFDHGHLPFEQGCLLTGVKSYDNCSGESRMRISVLDQRHDAGGGVETLPVLFR